MKKVRLRYANFLRKLQFINKSLVCDQKMVLMFSPGKKLFINLGKTSMSCVWDPHMIDKIQIVQLLNTSGKKI